MKKLLLLCLLLCGNHHLKAQENAQRPRGYHQHDGFYLSYNWGPVFGNVMGKVKSYNGSIPYTANFLGTGGMMDFKIGWAIKNNMILHTTFILNKVPAPEIITTVGNNSTSKSMPDKFEVDESMFGVGMTYYIMPYNIFLSGSIGRGKFKISGSENKDDDGDTNSGFSMQLKIGKEWWILKNWGAGLGLTYGKTNLTHQPPIGFAEKLDSNRFGILLNTTFN